MYPGWHWAYAGYTFYKLLVDYRADIERQTACTLTFAPIGNLKSPSSLIICGLWEEAQVPKLTQKRPNLDLSPDLLVLTALTTLWWLDKITSTDTESLKGHYLANIDQKSVSPQCPFSCAVWACPVVFKMLITNQDRCHNYRVKIIEQCNFWYF